MSSVIDNLDKVEQLIKAREKAIFEGGRYKGAMRVYNKLCILQEGGCTDVQLFNELSALTRQIQTDWELACEEERALLTEL